jgi:hypothetical protein
MPAHTCPGCGRPTNRADLCKSCERSGVTVTPIAPCPDCGGTVSSRAATCPHCGRVRSVQTAASTAPGTVLCLLLGGALFLVGLFYLFNPSAPLVGVEGLTAALDAAQGKPVDRVVNLQRLAFGQTFTVVGTLFLATGILRQRSR